MKNSIYDAGYRIFDLSNLEDFAALLEDCGMRDRVKITGKRAPKISISEGFASSRAIEESFNRVENLVWYFDLKTRRHCITYA